MVEQVLCMNKALGSILSTKNKKQEDRSVYFAELTLRSVSPAGSQQSGMVFCQVSRAHRQGHSTGHAAQQANQGPGLALHLALTWF